MRRGSGGGRPRAVGSGRAASRSWACAAEPAGAGAGGRRAAAQVFLLLTGTLPPQLLLRFPPGRPSHADFPNPRLMGRVSVERIGERTRFCVSRQSLHVTGDFHGFSMFHPFRRSCRYLGAVAGSTGIAFRDEQKVCELFTLTNWPCLL